MPLRHCGVVLLGHRALLDAERLRRVQLDAFGRFRIHSAAGRAWIANALQTRKQIRVLDHHVTNRLGAHVAARSVTDTIGGLEPGIVSGRLP